MATNSEKPRLPFDSFLDYGLMISSSKSVLYYGLEKPLPAAMPLRAGPLTMVFEPDTAVLRHIRLGDFEVCRAIYAAVRDEKWSTVVPQIGNLQPKMDKDCFELNFDVRCEREGIRYGWRGHISGAFNGQITYSFDGEAESTFLRNRIGICVLHPIAECAGKAIMIEHADGTVEKGVFPQDIAPHQPFKEIRGLSYEIHANVRAEFQFEGDIFEMEDQRNWCDASFKTYCTPLRLPIPVEVKSGDKLEQRCTLRLSSPKAVLPVVQGRPPQISIVTTRVQPLPPIGFCVAPEAEGLTPTEVARLKILRPSHLRVDLRLSDATYPRLLERAVNEGSTVGAPLYLAMTVTNEATAQLKGLRAQIDKLKPNVALWLVFHETEEATNDRWLNAAREALQSYAPNILFSGGTLDWFTEVNRNRPGSDSPWFTCYSLNPQVHAFDNTTLVENLEGQAFTLISARKISAKPVVISPVTLRLRNKWGTGTADFPPDVDARQMSLFGAGWTLGSIARLAGVDHLHSVTYYETKGWRGLMESESGSPLPDRFSSVPGGVFPMYHVFADIAEFHAQGIYGSSSTHPLQAEAITFFDDKKRRRILVANLTGETQEIKIKSGATPARVRLLDETNVEQAMAEPEAFRSLAGNVVQPTAAKIELQMLPFAIARVDIT
jgi:D-apionolactonase